MNKKELITNTNEIYKLFKNTYLKDNVYNINDDIDEIKKSKRSLKTKIELAKDALKELIEIKSILKEEKENGRIKKDSVDIFIKFNDYQISLINEFIDLLENNETSKLKEGDQISNYILPFVKTEKSSILERVKFFIYIKELYMQIKDKNNLCIKDYKNKQVIGDTDNNKYIVLDKRIGSESVYGQVYLSHFYKKLGTFAIKISSFALENFRKEIEILKKLTNEVLTFKCPHFPIIYGSINCNFNKENKNEIMVLNELANGDFYSFYKLYSDKNDLILNAIVQIILSLLFFYQRTKLFHKDTHGGNFLYHKIKPGGYFYYRLYGKDYYLKNLGFLWVCWDFGLATKITNKNKNNVHYDILRILGIIDNINDDIKFSDLFKTKNIDKIKDKKKKSKLLERKQYITNMTYSKYLNDTLNDVMYDIKTKYTGTDISILDDLSLYLIEEAFKKIPSFTDIKPSNIINKNPYILNKFVLKEPTKLQQEKEAILKAKTETTNLQTNVKTFKDTIKEGYVKTEKAQQAILNAKKIITNLQKPRIQGPISPILEDMPDDVSPPIPKIKSKSKPKFMIKKNKVSPDDYIKMKDDYKSNTYEWVKQAYKQGLTDTEILSYSGIGEKDYKLLNAFFTPDKIINDMFDLSFLYENLTQKKNYNDKKPLYILECSGGIGNIIYYILETINNNNPDLLKYIKIDFVEINKDFIEIARAKLDKYKDLITYHNMSFFNFKTDKKYEFIFGNPPYKLTINNKNIYDVDFFLKCWDLLSYKIAFLMSTTSITGNTKSHKLFKDIIEDYGISKKIIRDQDYGNQFRVYKNKEFQDKKTTQAGLTSVDTYLYVLEKDTSNNYSSSSEIVEDIPIVKRIKKERPISPILEDMPNDVSPPIKPKIKSNIKDKASNIIKKSLIPYINRTSINIIDRIRYFLIIKRYINSIKEKENCLSVYKIDTKNNNQTTYKIGNKIITDKQIGTKSASGIIFIGYYLSNTKGTKFDKLNKFAIKISEKNEENLNEIEILKKLTKLVIDFKCPHFPISYGYFECNKPAKSMLLPELARKKIYITLTELAGGDLHSLLITQSDDVKKKVKNIIAQCFISIMFFNHYTKLLHNDLHTGNFLYHKIKPGGYLHYNIYGKDYYLENVGYLMVIWDFNLSNNKFILSDKITYDFKYFLDVLIKYYGGRIKDLGDYAKEIEDVVNRYNEIKFDNEEKRKEMFKYILVYLSLDAGIIKTSKPDNIINKTPYIIDDILPAKPRIQRPVSPILEDMPDDVSPVIVKRIKKERPVSPILEDMPDDISPVIVKRIKIKRPISPILEDIPDDISPAIVKIKTKTKECPEGKEINPKTGRCIKIKEVKEGQKKRGRPKKIISEKLDTKPIEDKEPEKSLKKLLPNISVSFFYNVQPLIDDIKNSGYSIDYKLVKIKEILNDLQDIYDYVYEAMTQSKSSVVINKYKKFIDYTNDRINIINTYFKTLLELKFKKK